MRAILLSAGLLIAMPAALADPPPGEPAAAPIVNGVKVQPKPLPGDSTAPDPIGQDLLKQYPDHKDAPPAHDLYGKPESLPAPKRDQPP